MGTRGIVQGRRVYTSVLLPVLLLVLPLCPVPAAARMSGGQGLPAPRDGRRSKILGSSAPQPTTPPMATQPRNGPRIVAKDVLGGTQVVELRRFDASSGAWEVESAGGAVSLVPKCSLALDLGLPPQLRPGASPIRPILMESLL